MVEKGTLFGTLKGVMKRLLQIVLNVQVREKRDFDSMPKVTHKIAATEKALNGRGRTLIRYSGTEMLARVMLEGEDAGRIEAMAQDIAEEIRAEVGIQG